MNATATIPSRSSRNPAEALTIRMAMSSDAAAISRLAQLDSAPAPGPVPILLAEVGGQLLAALPLGGGRPIADPFRRTATLVVMLEERARQLEAPVPRRTVRRRRALRVPRPAPLRRA